MGVLATAGTLKADKYRDTKGRHAEDVTVVEHIGKGFVELVERGNTSGAEAEATVIESLEPLLDAGADTIVLGCTHYPFLENSIRKVIGGKAVFFDGGKGTAKELKRRLLEMNMENDGNKKGRVEFLNSRNSEEEKALCEKLFYL